MKSFVTMNIQPVCAEIIGADGFCFICCVIAGSSAIGGRRSNFSEIATPFGLAMTLNREKS